MKQITAGLMPRRVAVFALQALAALSAGASFAHEADWVYFPMYERDTAHAVHLSALKFRPDGLLDSASRYPRHSAIEWTEAESNAGWYDYAKRLIDCETGFSIETEAQLLDREGKVIASRTHGLDQWIAEIGRRLQNPTDRRWPDNSEIALACIAASHPTLRADRARRAAKPVPLITDAPTTQALIAESAVIAAIGRRYIDADAIRAGEPQTAEQVFERLQAQYRAWRRAINAGHVEATVPDVELVALRERLLDALRKNDVPPTTIELVSADVVDSLGDWQPLDGDASEFAPEAARRATTQRIDCRTDVAVSISTGWYSEDGRLLHSEPNSAGDALREISDRFPDANAIEPPNLLQPEPATSEACRFIATLRTTPDADTAPKGLDSLTPDQMRAAGSPAAMLMLIRGAL